MITTLVVSISVAIVVSAFCSVCEAALYSITSSQVELVKKTHAGAGEALEELRSDIDQPITAILTLNTIANTIGASIAGASAAKLLGDSNVIWFSAVFTLCILIFSEIMPKTIGVSFAYKLSPIIAFPLRFLVYALRPMILLSKLLTRLIPQKNEDIISVEELQAIAAMSLKSGEIDPNQERVISNVLVLQTKMVREVMTPRTVTFSLEEELSVAEAMQNAAELSAHSRVPVYHENQDNITGIIFRKDVLLAAAEQDGKKLLSELKQTVHFVPETASLNTVLIDFFERRQHLFVVVDEYGSMTGIISMEDILEEIVGQEIIDETDKTQDMRELARKQTHHLRRKVLHR